MYIDDQRMTPIRYRQTLGQMPTQPEVRRRITWLVLAAKLRTLLEQQLRSDDTAGIQDRRSRLIQLFESLRARPWDAHELYTRLFFLPNDPLAKLFRYRLATATRDRLRQILLDILRQTGEGTL